MDFGGLQDMRIANRRPNPSADKHVHAEVKESLDMCISVD